MTRKWNVATLHIHAPIINYNNIMEDRNGYVYVNKRVMS